VGHPGTAEVRARRRDAFGRIRAALTKRVELKKSENEIALAFNAPEFDGLRLVDVVVADSEREWGQVVILHSSPGVSGVLVVVPASVLTRFCQDKK